MNFVNVSTPLSIENYLHSPNGGGVGLDVTPDRFTGAVCLENLDPVTKLPGLYLTGQDIGICGVTLAQVRQYGIALL